MRLSLTNNPISYDKRLPLTQTTPFSANCTKTTTYFLQVGQPLNPVKPLTIFSGIASMNMREK